MRRTLALLALTLVAVAAPNVHAYTTMPSTGEDGIGNLETNYNLYLPDTQPGTAYGRSPSSAWVAAPAGSAWIGPSPESAETAADPAGAYCYALSFSVPDLQSISGWWATDNSAEIFLNGVSTGITKGDTGYTSLDWFTITGDFTGHDTLVFRVQNLSGGANPTGLLVSGLTGTVPTFVMFSSMMLPPVPAPGAALLVGIGASLCDWLRRRRTL